LGKKKLKASLSCRTVQEKMLENGDESLLNCVLFLGLNLPGYNFNLQQDAHFKEKRFARKLYRIKIHCSIMKKSWQIKKHV
jgi:hypothetical protein